MFVVTVTFEIHNQHVDDFKAAVLQQAHNSLNLEEACRQFDVCLNDEHPNQVFLYETYDDAAAFDVHRQTDHFAAFSAKVEPWIAGKQLQTWTTS